MSPASASRSDSAFNSLFPSAQGLIERHPGVLVCTGEISAFDRHVIGGLKRYAMTSPNGRARILLHGDEKNDLHEMLIAVPGFTIWPPLLNERAPQSWLVLEGELAFVRYEPPGNIVAIQKLSADGRAGPSFLRFSAHDWYTTVPLSPMTVYLETKLGPHTGTTSADWGPQSNQDAKGEALIKQLESLR